MVNIKKIIREEFELFNNELGIQTPFSWLVDNFGNLTPDEINKDGRIIYRNPKGEWCFYHYQGDEYDGIFINYSKIWSKLEKDFNLKNTEIQDVIEDWLKESYNLIGFTPGVGTGDPYI